MIPARVDWDELVGRVTQIIAAVDVRAAWLAGGVAFGRMDEHSDVDLVVVVDDDAVAATFAAIEAKLPPIELQWEVPQPTWHGAAQRFYRFADAPPLLMLDLAVLQVSNPKRFLHPARHGRPRVLFDPEGLAVPGPTDATPVDIASLRAKTVLFAPFVGKAMARGHHLEALSWYHRFVLQPLVTALRLTHDPVRYDFGVRYAHRDLPPGVVARLERLHYPSSPAQLSQLCEEAQGWFGELIEPLLAAHLADETASPPSA